MSASRGSYYDVSDAARTALPLNCSEHCIALFEELAADFKAYVSSHVDQAKHIDCLSADSNLFYEKFGVSELDAYSLTLYIDAYFSKHSSDVRFLPYCNEIRYIQDCSFYYNGVRHKLGDLFDSEALILLRYCCLDLFEQDVSLDDMLNWIAAISTVLYEASVYDIYYDGLNCDVRKIIGFLYCDYVFEEYSVFTLDGLVECLGFYPGHVFDDDAIVTEDDICEYFKEPLI